MLKAISGRQTLKVLCEGQTVKVLEGVLRKIFADFLERKGFFNVLSETLQTSRRFTIEF